MIPHPFYLYTYNSNTKVMPYLKIRN